MARIRIPPIDVPAIDLTTGRFVPDWYDVIKGLEKLGLLDLSGVTNGSPTDGQFLAYSTSSGGWTLEPITPPANAQVLIWDASNKRWFPGAN